MEKYVIDKTTLTGIGDAIREKEGTTEGIDPSDMKARILAIKSGGSTVPIVTIDGRGTDMPCSFYFYNEGESVMADDYVGFRNTTIRFLADKQFVECWTTSASRLFETFDVSGDFEFVKDEENRKIVKICGDCNIRFVIYCLTGDTLITMSDGTLKRIDSVSVGDKVLSYNPETMRLEADEVVYSDATENKIHTQYDIWTFENGLKIKTVHRHRFYNVEKQAMVYMDEWDIGEHAIDIHGKPIALVKHETVEEKINHYTIFTKNQNYFANGLLSGNRYTKSLIF